MKPKNKYNVDYNTEPYLKISLTILEREGKYIEINGVEQSIGQTWSFLLGKELDTDVTYGAIAKLLNWTTVNYKLNCCLSWDGEVVDVLVNQGSKYVINKDRQIWLKQVELVANPDSVIRLQEFDWL